MKDKGDSSIPGGFKHIVPQALLVETVVPLGKVTSAIRVIGRRPNLPAIDAAATAKSKNTKGQGKTG